MLLILAMLQLLLTCFYMALQTNIHIIVGLV